MTHQIERKNKRIQFLNDHAELCEDAFKVIAGKKLDWKTIAGRRLVEHARTKLGYSKKTASNDIFRTLFDDYCGQLEHKVEPVDEVPKFNIYESEAKVNYEDEPKRPNELDNPVYNMDDESNTSRLVAVCVAVFVVLAFILYFVNR